jgi:DNA helicase-2/ATP-dependent DNA helicase PcrA
VSASSLPHRRRRAYESATSGERDEPHYEPDPEHSMNQDVPRFVKGERVVPDTFGSGAVVEISGFGRDLMVTVDFDDAGRKKLLLRYATLEKDWP